MSSKPRPYDWPGLPTLWSFREASAWLKEELAPLPDEASTYVAVLIDGDRRWVREKLAPEYYERVRRAAGIKAGAHLDAVIAIGDDAVDAGGWPDHAALSDAIRAELVATGDKRWRSRMAMQWRGRGAGGWLQSSYDEAIIRARDDGRQDMVRALEIIRQIEVAPEDVLPMEFAPPEVTAALEQKKILSGSGPHGITTALWTHYDLLRPYWRQIGPVQEKDKPELLERAPVPLPDHVWFKLRGGLDTNGANPFRSEMVHLGQRWEVYVTVDGVRELLFQLGGPAEQPLDGVQAQEPELPRRGRPRAEWIKTAQADMEALEQDNEATHRNFDGSLKSTREVINVLMERSRPLELGATYKLLPLDENGTERVEIGDDAPPLKGFNDNVLAPLRRASRQPAD